MDIAVYGPDTLPVWSPQWHLIENAWLPDGGMISGEARQEIERAVSAYLRREAIARAVPFQGDIAGRIQRLRTAVATLARALEVFRQGEGSREARSRLSSFLVLAADDEPHLERLPRDLRDIIHAADMALEELREDERAHDKDADSEALHVRPFRKWDAWDIMIPKLHDIAKKHKLPTAIDNHRISDGDPVPFIDAIIEIETALPAGFRRYDTRGSLAQAILAMLRNGRKGDK